MTVVVVGEGGAGGGAEGGAGGGAEGGLKTETLHNGFHLPVFVPALPPCSASCWSQRHTAAVNIQSASLICKWADYVSK